MESLKTTQNTSDFSTPSFHTVCMDDESFCESVINQLNGMQFFGLFTLISFFLSTTLFYKNVKL